MLARPTAPARTAAPNIKFLMLPITPPSLPATDSCFECPWPARLSSGWRLVSCCLPGRAGYVLCKHCPFKRLRTSAENKFPQLLPEFRGLIEPVFCALRLRPAYRHERNRSSETPSNLSSMRSFFAIALVLASAAPHTPVQQKEIPMTHHAHGTFTVKVQPLTPAPAEGLSRFSIDKEIHGDLEATSKGEMLGGGDYRAGSGRVCCY